MNEQALLTIRADLGVLDDDVRARLRNGVLDLVGLDADGIATIKPATVTGIVREPVLIDTIGEDTDIIDLTDRTLERRRAASRGAGAPPRGRILLAAAAVIVALLVVGNGLARQSTKPDTQVTATLSTATNGDELIAALGGAPDTPLPDGSYDYERIESAAPVNGGPQTSVGTSAVWVDNKGTGRVVNSANELRVSPTPGAASTPGLEAPSDLPYDKPGSLLFRTLTYADLRALPTEPAALKNELIRLSGASAPTIEDLYDRMGDLLTLQATPPGVRVGLARLLMDNGATVLGPVQDRNGRQGLGVAAPLADGSRRVFVLDTTTYRRLGDFTVPAGATTSAAAAIAWNTVLDNLIVDSTATR